MTWYEAPFEVEERKQLAEWLDDLDKAWLGVMQMQVWDWKVGEFVDLEVAAEGGGGVGGAVEMCQTDRARLRSTILDVHAVLERWLVLKGGEEEEGEADEGFEGMFSRTLMEMGAFSGVMNDPDGVRGTC